MSWTSEKKRTIIAAILLIGLVTAATIIVVQYPDALNGVFSKTQRPDLQILSRNCIDGRNDSISNGVNASFTVVVKNIGATNQSKTLVCSVSYKVGSNTMTYDNRTMVTLSPDEQRTYYAIVILPEDAKSVDWNLDTVFVN